MATRELRQSTAVDVPIGPFLSSVDGVTPMTSLVITQPDLRLKKNGANWAQKNAAQTLVHEENGSYEVSFDATDTNSLGLLRLQVFKPGSVPVVEDFAVITANEYDSKYGSDRREVDAWEWLGQPIVTPTVAGVPTVDVDRISGDQGASANLKAGYNGTGYAAPNSSIGSVTNIVTANMTQANGNGTVITNFANEYNGTGYKSYLRRGTAQGGGASTITLDASASSATDLYKNLIVAIMAGTGAGQSAISTAYNGTTKVLTINGTWPSVNPDNTSVFELLPLGAIPGASAPTASDVADEVETRTIAAVTLVNGLANNVITTAAINDGALTAAKIASDAITAANLAADVTTELQTGLATAASISALNNLSAVQVNAEVVDALSTDTYTEIGQESPSATAALSYMIRFLYKLARNGKRTNTNTNERELLNDAGNTVDQQSSLTSAGGVSTAGKWTTGP